jgi:hypothetical protein
MRNGEPLRRPLAQIIAWQVVDDCHPKVTGGFSGREQGTIWDLSTGIGLKTES